MSALQIFLKTRPATKTGPFYQVERVLSQRKLKGKVNTFFIVLLMHSRGPRGRFEGFFPLFFEIWSVLMFSGVPIVTGNTTDQKNELKTKWLPKWNENKPVFGAFLLH